MSKKEKKAGRPSLSESGRTTRRSLPVPDEQWNAWKAAAKKAGVSVSEWIRRTCDAAS